MFKLETSGIRQAIRGEIPKIKSEQQKFLVCENAENFCFIQHKVSLSNDEKGNLLKVIDAYAETTSQMTYDAVGNPLEATDALGNTVTSEYDVLNRLIESIDPLGGRTELAYNGNNELTTVTDALGGQSRQDFDADGNRISLVNTNNGLTTFV